MMMSKTKNHDAFAVLYIDQKPVYTVIGSCRFIVYILHACRCIRVQKRGS